MDQRENEIVFPFREAVDLSRVMGDILAHELLSSFQSTKLFDEMLAIREELLVQTDLVVTEVLAELDEHDPQYDAQQRSLIRDAKATLGQSDEFRAADMMLHETGLTRIHQLFPEGTFTVEVVIPDKQLSRKALKVLGGLAAGFADGSPVWTEEERTSIDSLNMGILISELLDTD
jgi:hypothetical protein